jgi:DNA-binding CsgD family transcriptional regulator
VRYLLGVTPQVESVCRTMLGAAADAVTVPDLGGELSRQLGRIVPHDGYMLVGLDPLTGAGCFQTRQRGYCLATARRPKVDSTLHVHPHQFVKSATGPRHVGVLSAGLPELRRSALVHDVMAGEGIVSEMRIALTLAGIAWGVLILVRERGSKPFSPTEAAHAELIAEPAAASLRRFVASKALRPARRRLPPGVVIVGADDKVRSMTPSGRDWLRELVLVPDPTQASDQRLVFTALNITHLARSATGPAVTRIPTSQGWVVLHAQLLDGSGTGDVAVTIQPATAALLLPALCAWYGITPRERVVVEQSLEGLPVKHIARRLDLSPHTVNDHLKAIYRKTGVSSREELITGLS